MPSVFSKVGLTLLCLSSLAVGANAQIKKVSGGYLFRLKFVAGRTYNYTIASQVHMGSVETVLSGPAQFKILKLNSNGANVQASFGPIKAGGQVFSPKQSLSFDEDHRGVVNGKGGIQQMSVEMPPAPKQVGDSWTAKTGIAASGGPTNVEAKYKFMGLKTVDGHQVAVLSVNYKSSGTATAAGTGVIYLLIEDGSLYSTATKLKVGMGQQTGNVSMKMSRN
jgi:hypothetical protein